MKIKDISSEYLRTQLKMANTHIKNTLIIRDDSLALNTLKNYINKALTDMTGPTFNAESNFNNKGPDASSEISAEIQKSVKDCRYKMYDYIEPKQKLNYQDINSINANLSSARMLYDNLIEEMNVIYQDFSKSYNFVLEGFKSISKINYDTQYKILSKL